MQPGHSRNDQDDLQYNNQHYDIKNKLKYGISQLLETGQNYQPMWGTNLRTPFDLDCRQNEKTNSATLP